VAINTQTLFDQKTRQYGTGASTTRFTADFLEAVNFAISDFNLAVGIDADQITSVSEDVGLDVKYAPTFAFGVDYYMLSIGGYNNRETSITYQQYQAALKRARHQYMSVDVTVDGTAGVKGKFGKLADQ
jgi:hypothetical protein